MTKVKSKKIKKIDIKKINKETKNVDSPVVQNRNISSIDNLWGVISSKKYQTTDLDEYVVGLHQLTPLELEKHAIEYEISPNVPRDIVIDQLIRLFKLDKMAGKNKGKLQEIPQITPEMNKELIKIVNS